MASYDDSPNYQFWLAVERPAIVNRVALFNDLVGNFRAPSWTRPRERAFWLHNAQALNQARARLVLGDRLHELRRLTQTVRALARTPPLALEVASELWRAELEAVAAQYAAYGPIGADPGPDPFPGQI